MILDKIVERTKLRVEADKKKIPLEQMKAMAYACYANKGDTDLEDFAFEQALAGEDMAFICEVKKASPSKGVIAEDFPYVDIAKDYEKSGASCISVLTEPEFFLGSDQYLQEIRQAVRIPIIRKDFLIDEYQIYQAKVLGANAVLLICAILDTDTIKKYMEICDSLGLSALVETHGEEEIASALKAGARILGVNNRNLKDFTVDIHNSTRLRALVPEKVLFVAESGIKTGKDIHVLRKAKVNGVLIGETLMRAKNKARILNTLRGTKVKICGLRRMEDVAAANEVLPDYVGFVFADTRRKVSKEQARAMREALREEIKTVGVFVNAPIEEIVSLAEEGIINYIQLHGDEDMDYLQELKAKTKKPVIRAIRVKEPQDIIAGSDLPVEGLLLDTYSKEAYGGTGEVFTHEWIPEDYRPYFLAGGLSPENIEDKLRQLRPYAVDVSSGVETDGIKDIAKMKEFVQKVRECYE